jgi:hypothetical protein
MSIKVGTVLQDNDPRTKGKRVMVIAVENDDGTGHDQPNAFAVYQAGRRKARICFTRIFDDGVKRTKGFTVVRA